MLTRTIKDGRVCIESTEGFTVEPSFPNGNGSCVVYSEGDQTIVLDAVLWYDSAEDREANLLQMTRRQREKLFERTIMLVYVPEVLKWRKTNETISKEDRSRIFANIRAALEFDNVKPRFVRERRGI